MTGLTVKLVTLLATIIPFNIVLFKITNSIFKKEEQKINRATTICTNVDQTLTKELLTTKSIYFEKYEALIKKEKPFIYLTNKETRKEKKLNKKDLGKEKSINIIATITTFCHYPKIHKLESIISNFLKECHIENNLYRNIYKKLAEIPSNEEKKISTVVLQQKNSKEIFAYSKGNAYKLLEKCSRIYKDGKNIQLDTKYKRKLKNQIKHLTETGEKTIAFAYRPLPLKKLDNYDESFTEKDLVWVAMVGLGHEINEELIPVFEKIKELNVKTYIITRTKKHKAISIGEKLKILNTKYFEAFSGEDIKELKMEKLKKMLQKKEKDFIFYRTEKKEKEKIIQALKENKEIVISTKENNSNNIKDIYDILIKSEHENQNKPRNYYLTFSLKIAEFILVLSSILLNAPLPLTISLILVLDILINSIIEISIKEEKGTLDNQKILENTLFNGITTGLILTIIYFYLIISLGWYPGEIIDSNSELISKSVSTIFLILGIKQIINGYTIKNPNKSLLKLNYKRNISLVLSSIICLLIFYVLYKFHNIREMIFISSLNSVNLTLITFIIILLICIDEFRKYLFKDTNYK